MENTEVIDQSIVQQENVNDLDDRICREKQSAISTNINMNESITSVSDKDVKGSIQTFTDENLDDYARHHQNITIQSVVQQGKVIENEKMKIALY